MAISNNQIKVEEDKMRNKTDFILIKDKYEDGIFEELIYERKGDNKVDLSSLTSNLKSDLTSNLQAKLDKIDEDMDELLDMLLPQNFEASLISKEQNITPNTGTDISTKNIFRVDKNLNSQKLPSFLIKADEENGKKTEIDQLLAEIDEEENNLNIKNTKERKAEQLADKLEEIKLQTNGVESRLENRLENSLNNNEGDEGVKNTLLEPESKELLQSISPIRSGFQNNSQNIAQNAGQNELTPAYISTLPKEQRLGNFQNNSNLETYVENVVQKVIQKELGGNVLKGSSKNSIATKNLFVAGTAVVVACLVLINIFWFLNFENKQNLPTDRTTVGFVANAGNLVESGKKSYSVSNFITDPSVIEVQTQLDYKASQIATKNSPNCQLSVLPPDENNCSFIISPTLFNINQQGMVFLGVEILGSLSDQDLQASQAVADNSSIAGTDKTNQSKILIETRDLEKNSTIKQLATVDAGNINTFVPFKDVANSKEVINFRLWQQGSKAGNIQIKGINFRYISVDNLVSVGGKVELGSQNTSLTAKIYRDTNQNGALDELDHPWTCGENLNKTLGGDFPGVLPVSIGLDGSFILERDETCYGYSAPASWNGDSKRKSLPAGKWLMVFDDKKSISFEVKDGQNNDSAKNENEQLRLKI